MRLCRAQIQLWLPCSPQSPAMMILSHTGTEAHPTSHGIRRDPVAETGYHRELVRQRA